MNKNKNKKIIIMAILLMTFFSMLFAFIFKYTSAFPSDNLNSGKVIYEENITSYESIDGIHNIYWAQGVKPPKMSIDPNLIGTEGYFNLEKYNGFETYSVEYNINDGYFDYNKNLKDRPDEHPLCYLGAASNLISWWLNQNNDYVSMYLDRLKNTNIYGQDPSLYKILPYNENVWNEIMMNPGIELEDGKKAQKLGLSPLSNKYLKPYYYKKDDGYFSDLVFDFFFNGYDAIPDKSFAFENTEDKYKKDPRGGFFYPVFGKTRLSDRKTGKEATDYEIISKNLRTYLVEGKGVVFAYIVNSDLAHAITVWGAEYDSSGKLVRVFITDSDDYQTSKKDDEFWRGLVGFNTVPDDNGTLTLTSKKEYDPAKPGVRMYEIITLDLAKDLWEEKLADISSPIAPTITSASLDKVYALGAKNEIRVDASLKDNSFLEYKWYVTDDINIPGKLLGYANKNILEIDANNIGVKYYYCIVSANKNGKSADTKSRYIKVDVRDIPLVNAETPKVNFRYDITVNSNQYDTPKVFKVNAAVNKGTLSYQWYKSSSSYATNGIKLDGETNSYFYPPTNDPGSFFYYCEITNTDDNVSGNSKSTVTTNYSKRINVNKSPLMDAKTPFIIDKSSNLEVNVNEKAKIYVNAKVFDGGMLSYKWYKVENGNNLTLLSNEVKSTLNINTKVPGVYKYKCEVTNTNIKASKNKIASTFIEPITVIVKGDTILSSENDLTSLKLKNANLEPAFSKDITSYKTVLPHQDNLLIIDAIPSEKATITIDNPKVSFGEVKTVTITVTAEDFQKKEYKIEVSRSNVHAFGPWLVLEEATCQKEGLEKRVCPICKHEETRKTAKTDHIFGKEWVIDTPATCQKEGEKSHHCDVCGKRTDITKIPKLEHNFGKWNVVKGATCLEDGLEERICTLCNHKETRVINKTGHVWDKDFTIDIKPTTTSYGEKSIHCSKCDARKDITKIDKLPEEHISHTFGSWIIKTKPTCTENGIEHRFCKVCGIEETRVINKTGHVWDKDFTIDIKPTTTSYGEKSVHCSKCDARKDITKIDKLPEEHKVHDFSDWKVVKEATEKESGLERRTCKICGFSEEKVIPKIENPKTGVNSYLFVTIVTMIVMIFISGFIYFKKLR